MLDAGTSGAEVEEVDIQRGARTASKASDDLDASLSTVLLVLGHDRPVPSAPRFPLSPYTCKECESSSLFVERASPTPSQPEPPPSLSAA